MNRKTLYATGLLACLLAACATQRPVLYPNSTLNSRGKAAAQADVDQCMQLADNADLQNDPSLRVAEHAAKRGAVGAVTGAAAGAVVGHAGRGAGIGAAAGTAGGLVEGMFSAKEPDPLYRAYVDRCLRDRGYDSIGWR